MQKDDDDMRLRQMIDAAELTYREMAAVFGISRDALAGRLKRMGLHSKRKRNGLNHFQMPRRRLPTRAISLTKEQIKQMLQNAVRNTK